MTFDYDLFVIGGGSGGVRAARVAASEHGIKVGLAEESRMGGTCVIRGCVPKKLMVFASSFTALAEEGRAYGWDMKLGDFDWPAFRGKLEGELDRLEGIYRRLLNNAGVTAYDTRAAVKDAHTVMLDSGEEITAKHILIATGGWPTMPHIPGSEHAITSNEIFHLDKLPKSILIKGGGFIACEFACIMNGLGVDVTLAYRGDQVLRGFDDEARGLVAAQMAANGVRVLTGTEVTHITLDEEGARVVKTQNGAGDGTYDQVMIATGRKPNTDGLGLEALGVELDRAGAVVVDEYSQTAVPSIYAIGDVTNRVNLTPVAIREGMAFVATVYEGKPTPVDHDLIPAAVFTQPELGTTGLSEEEAAKQGPIEVYSTSFKPMRQSFAGQEAKVMMKLVVCAKTRKVLGCHIVAPDAGEMIQLAGIAVKMGATKEDFDRTCAVHPTMSEELVTMKSPVRTT
ncbi:glutathione-disulfide reductase [Alphaproteobacteria bacterium KMM 3653]|uniref:Glutathione reductase n=1 Tax=Harenicola maris TaxID=2841044 RepID=A0AAP2CQD0_9RHOB|nr:glutathione-disulfide reductase [Harenicola maris]